jgi:hypothetical protein
MLLRGLRLRRLTGRVFRFGFYNVVGLALAIFLVSLLLSHGVLKSAISPIFANSNLVNNKSGSAVQKGGEFADQTKATKVVSDAPGGEYFDVRIGTTLGHEASDQSSKQSADANRHNISLSAVLQARPLALIAERQSVPFPVVRLAPVELAPLKKAVAAFLPVWESFDAGVYTVGTVRDDLIDRAHYRHNLAPVVSPNADIARMIARYDSHAPATVGLCDRCDTGSRWAGDIDPTETMVVRSYDGDFAFVTTQGVVTYIGHSSYAGARIRRTYSLVLVRTLGTWRVQRAAADTLARL